MSVGEGAAPSRLRVVAAFAAVYLLWGSTYLAIRVAIDTIPPLFMVGTRFLLAGAVLYAWIRLRRGPKPTGANWRAAAIVGTLLLVVGNGALVVAEQTVPTGVAALLVAMVPVWMVVLDWLWRGGARPGVRVATGLALGLAGIVLLVGPGAFGGGAIDPKGAALLVVGPMAWATGSIYSRRAPLPSSALLGTAMEMLCAGAVLLVLAPLSGELGALHPAAVAAKSVLALGYLVVFGSLVGFTAYVWLLANVTPTRLATYAYVNPVVAVALGWAVLGEALTPRMGVAATTIVAAVVLITMAGARRREPQARELRGVKGRRAA